MANNTFFHRLLVALLLLCSVGQARAADTILSGSTIIAAKQKGNNLTTAVAQASTNTVSIWITDSTVLSAPTTVRTTTTLTFAGAGKINCGAVSGVLTVKGPIEGGDRLLFQNCPATSLSFTGNTVVKVFHVAWFDSPTVAAAVLPAGAILDTSIISGSGTVSNAQTTPAPDKIPLSDPITGKIAAGWIADASGTVRGVLNSTDWTTFNNKIDTNDIRLSDARTPTAHASSHLSNGTDPIGAASTTVRGSVTTTTSNSQVVSTNDTRNSDARTPTGTAGGALAGAFPNPDLATGAVTDTTSSLANKPSVGLVATANLTLSGAQTIDGQLGVAGTTLVLATAQTAGAENGPWVMQTSAWTRPTWYPNGGTTQAFQFITTFVRLGTLYQGSVWRLTTASPITIDTTATTWMQTPAANSQIYADEVDSSKCTGGTLTGCVADNVAAGSPTRALIVRGNMLRGSNVVIPANIIVDFTRGFGTFDCQSTATAITILGPIVAPDRQIFANCGGSTTAARVSFAGNIYVSQIKSVWYGDTGDGTTNDSPFIRDAQAGCSTLPNGGVIRVGPGTHKFTTQLVPYGSKCILEGAGRTQTILSMSIANGIIASSAAQIPTVAEYTIRNLTLKATDAATPNLLSIDGFSVSSILVDNVEVDFSGLTVAVIGMSFVGVTSATVQNCFFHSDGRGFGQGIVFTSGGQGAIVRNNRFDYLKTGVNVNTNPTTRSWRDVRIEDNTFEFGFWLQQSSIFNSGGTVTYSSTTITDSAAAFGSLVPRYVRIMTPIQTSSATVTYNSPGTRVTDTAALFITNAVKPGDIVRAPASGSGAATEFAWVIKVVSETELQISEWRSMTTYLRIGAPAANSAYTVYGWSMTTILSNTATVLTLTGGYFNWYGTTTTPANGTLYEVLPGRLSYPIFADTGVSALTITNNMIHGSDADSMGLQSSSRAVLTGNNISDGSDVGMTLNGGNFFVGYNIFRHQGTVGVWLIGSHNTVEANQFYDMAWANTVNMVYDGAVLIWQSTDNKVLANYAECSALATLCRYGFVLHGAGATNNTLRDNTAVGSLVGGLRFDTATITGTLFGPNNFGTYSVTATTGGIWQDTATFAYGSLPASPEDSSRLWTTGTDANCTGSGSITQWCLRVNGAWVALVTYPAGIPAIGNAQMISGRGANTALSTSVVNCIPLSYNIAPTTQTAANELTLAFPVKAGTLSKLHVGVSAAPTGATKTWTAVVRKSTDNGTTFANITQTCTITDTATSCDATQTDTVAEGDLIDLCLTPANTPTSAKAWASVYHSSSLPIVAVAQRFQPTLGTTLVAGDFVLSGGWGNTATIGTITGNDQRWQATVTSSGTGQGANPTIALTYKDGTWTTAPISVVVRNGGTGVGCTGFTVSSTATVQTSTCTGTPSASETYVIQGRN